MLDADLFDLLQRLAMALGIGFLVGVERGWRHREAPEGARAAGLRTHAVAGLFGGVAGALLPSTGAIGFAALAAGFAAAFIAFKLRESARDNDISVTGTLAGLLVFALGAYAVLGDLRIAAAVGVTLVALLAFKESLHTWLDALSWVELRSALLILAATAIALPLLPNRALDPWGAINPRELWLLTILVAGASFGGYVAVRVLGDGLGVWASAAAGALVSSTVVTAELGRRARAGQSTPQAAAGGAALAASVSLARVTVFVAAAANAVVPAVAPSLLAAGAAFLSGAWLLGRDGDDREPVAKTRGALPNPLDLREVARFALFLGAVIIVGRLLSELFGEAGVLPFAAAAGVADVDAVSMAVASLIHGGLALEVGAQAILLAALVNTVAKGAIAAATGGWAYAGRYLAVAALAALCGALVWWFATPWLSPMFS